MDNKLDGKKVAILVTDGFEEAELASPKEALENAGAETKIVSPAEKKVKAWDETDWGSKYKVDVPLNEANAADYDALVLPGGVMNPDHFAATAESHSVHPRVLRCRQARCRHLSRTLDAD